MATTKERILHTTTELFRRHGYTGTGLKQIVAQANAPFGSIYHHFPGGKEQLGEQVIRTSGQMYLELVATIAAQAPDVVSGVRDLFSGAAETLRETDYADACPIETVALEVASTNEPLRHACADVFELWIDSATAWLAASGIPESRARELALTVLCLLEGAFVFCRAMRTTEPLEVAGATAAAALEAALAEQPG